jgi:hypothetical protein
VFGEIWFSHKARLRSEKLQGIIETKLTQALDRAAGAEQALIKFRTPRDALLTDAALELIIEKLKPFSGTKFDVGHDPMDGEQWDFLWRLEPTISKSGWVLIDWIGSQTFTHPNWPTNHQYGSAAVLNVSIEIHPESRSKLKPAAEALASALKAIEIDVATDKFNTHSKNADVVHLLVGFKR